MVHFSEINQAPPPYSFAVYWQSSNTEACAKKLSQTLANNIDNGGEGNWSQNICEVLSKKLNKK